MVRCDSHVVQSSKQLNIPNFHGCSTFARCDPSRQWSWIGPRFSVSPSSWHATHGVHNMLHIMSAQQCPCFRFRCGMQPFGMGVGAGRQGMGGGGRYCGPHDDSKTQRRQHFLRLSRARSELGDSNKPNKITLGIASRRPPPPPPANLLRLFTAPSYQHGLLVSHPHPRRCRGTRRGIAHCRARLYPIRVTPPPPPPPPSPISTPRPPARRRCACTVYFLTLMP